MYWTACDGIRDVHTLHLYIYRVHKYIKYIYTLHILQTSCLFSYKHNTLPATYSERWTYQHVINSSKLSTSPRRKHLQKPLKIGNQNLHLVETWGGCVVTVPETGILSCQSAKSAPQGILGRLPTSKFLSSFKEEVFGKVS